MPCAVGCLALFFPRVILVLVWLFGDGWLQAAFSGMLMPILGFLFLPLTTLAYAWAWHAGDGNITLPLWSLSMASRIVGQSEGSGWARAGMSPMWSCV